MNCTNCEHYRNGKGDKACLNCKQYLEVKLQTTKRHSIVTEYLPDTIMDNIEDTRTRTLIDIIKTLPTKYSVPLMMQGVLDMSVREIAEYHKTAKTNIQRVLQFAQDLLKAAIHAR